MNTIEIESRLHREQIELASINKRSVAYAIDEILVSVLFAIIVWDQLKVIKTPEAMMAYSSSLFVYIMSVKIIYQTVFVYMYGASLGKLAMKIRVIESDYLGLPTLKQAILRAIMRVISEMVFYFGYIVAFFSPIRLTWHDRVATTLVIDV
jgi:uncharacterized RDD family membrane protein YckC